jgi:hypothetical protein
MNKIQLYELGVATGKSLVGESDAVQLSLAIATAAETNKVAGVDFGFFTQTVNQTRQLYIGLAQQKLQSEIAAAQAQAKQPAAPVSNATAAAPAQPEK